MNTLKKAKDKATEKKRAWAEKVRSMVWYLDEFTQKYVRRLKAGLSARQIGQVAELFRGEYAVGSL